MDHAAYLRRVRTLRPELRHLYATSVCDGEVCNGGFYQFYSNRTGVLGPEAVEAFDAIGLPEFAEIVRETLRMFGSSFPREHDKRERMLTSMAGGDPDAEHEIFNAFDTSYYAITKRVPAVIANAADAYTERSGLVDPKTLE
jgi:hypothetical protein